LPTHTGQLWANLEGYKVILYPFVEGRDAYALPLADAHWVELGRALRQIHGLTLPAEIKARIPLETYSPQWRDSLKALLADETRWVTGDPASQKAAGLLRTRRDEIMGLVRRAEALVQVLHTRPARHVLCHTDLHAGNLLIDSTGEFFIVDWDAPLLALKEHDLMYPGGAQGFSGHTPEEEERLFFQGYGQVEVNRQALAYYRCERIVQDIAIFGEQLLLSAEGGEDREQSCGYLASNFLPGGTVEMARRADKLCP
jgi:spectinomycin phosphotransferase